MAGLPSYKRKLESPVVIITDLNNPPNQSDFTLYFTLARSLCFYQTKEKPPPEVIKVNMRNLDCKIVLVSLCVLHLFSASEGRPPRSVRPPEPVSHAPVRGKRTVSEVQLMHNLGEHRQVQERRQWLQMKLRGIHTAAARAASGEPGRAKRRLSPEELPDLSDLTPEEIQYALSFLEKLLKSKRP